MTSLLNLTRTVLCAGLAAAAWAQPAVATPLALAKSYEGNINVAGTQASLQSRAGGAKVCDLVTEASASISLPDKAKVVSATLYWAGTGALDAEVLLNGAAVAADAGRRYASSIDGFTYFAAAADVTTLVGSNTSFKFGGLKVDVSDTYCAKQQKENSMIAGFALVVVYAATSEPYRTVNLYEGLHAIKNSSVTVRMPDYAPAGGTGAKGRFGYIVWEGDKSGQQKNDHVSFNGETLRAEPFIQKDDAFNSKSGANSDEKSMGIDFDFAELSALPAKAADASAVFTTANDRVLLGTAIMAMPSRRADLGIKKSYAGDFRPDSEITYTLEVSNLGGRADSKVEVKDTLPAALSYVSYSGADWRCAVTGQTVACSYGKALAPGDKASVQIKARIVGEGRIANTATVSGTGDGNADNDSSTVEEDAGTRPTGGKSFVFTVGSCTPGETIKAAGQPGCARFKGPVTAGGKPSIYLTYAVDGTAVALDPSKDVSPSLRFSLVCNNPATSAGTQASYAGIGLGACVDEAGASAADGKPSTLSFPRNTASVKAEFHYPDVGIVTLRAHDAAGVVATTGFASLPTRLGVAYLRPDGVVNPGKPALTDGAFAEAGEPFLAVVSAYGLDGVGPLPNFGNETGEYAPAKRLGIVADGGQAEQDLLKSDGGWQWSKDKPVRRSLVWNEAGMASLYVRLDDYLGVAEADHETKAEAVGRFYPHYFETVTSMGFGCLPRMQCPTAAGQLISRAVYSKQPFTAVVRAYGRGGLLGRFAASYVPPISLTPVSSAGHDGKALGAFANAAPLARAQQEPVYHLAKGYDARSGERDWTPPTAVYVRARAPELRKTVDGTQAVEISTLRTDPKTASLEGGIMVINGRLMVGNVIGTPLAKTPVPLRAQYWSGTAWEQNGGAEDANPVSGTVQFEGCRRSLRLGDACNMSIVRVDGSEKGGATVLLPMLKEGRASLVLAPVGDRSGNVDLLVDREGKDDYLPSTIGRVSFGQFKSPVIYIREGY